MYNKIKLLLEAKLSGVSRAYMKHMRSAKKMFPVKPEKYSEFEKHAEKANKLRKAIPQSPARKSKRDSPKIGNNELDQWET